jgi:hypothetical protein
MPNAPLAMKASSDFFQQLPAETGISVYKVVIARSFVSMEYPRSRSGLYSRGNQALKTSLALTASSPDRFMQAHVPGSSAPYEQ